MERWFGKKKNVGKQRSKGSERAGHLQTWLSPVFYKSSFCLLPYGSGHFPLKGSEGWTISLTVWCLYQEAVNQQLLDQIFSFEEEKKIKIWY